MRLLFLYILIFTSIHLQAQDTLSVVKLRHSPQKAALFSAALPGLGQAYNKKYWKIPIIYGSAAALAYSINFNNDLYQEYLNDFRKVSNPDTNISKQYTGPYSADNLIILKDFYRRNRDLSVIGVVLLYGLTIIDAYVDAQLFNFDVSDDLSISMNPYLAPSLSGNTYGLALRLNFGETRKHRTQP